MLAAPLAERPSGFAFEIDDDEVLAGVEHLSEMQVAMAADASDGQFTFKESAEARENPILMSQKRLSHALHLGRSLGENFRSAAAQEPEDLAGKVSHRLVDRT